MSELSFEEVSGQPPSIHDVAGGEEELSFEEVVGKSSDSTDQAINYLKRGGKTALNLMDNVLANPQGGGVIKGEEFEQSLHRDTGLKATALNAARDVGRNVAGSVVALEDMFAGLAGMAIGTGAYAGTRAYAAGAGETNKAGAQAAAVSAEHFTPEALSTPFRKVLRHLGYEDFYDDSIVSKGMHWISGKIAEGSEAMSKETKGVVQPEDFQALASAAMLYFGTKGSDIALRRGQQARENAKWEQRARESDAQRYRRPMEEPNVQQAPVVPLEEARAPEGATMFPELTITEALGPAMSRAAQLRGEVFEVPGLAAEAGVGRAAGRAGQLESFHYGTEVPATRPEGTLTRTRPGGAEMTPMEIEAMPKDWTGTPSKEQLLKAAGNPFADFHPKIDKTLAAKVAAAGGVAAYIAANPEQAEEIALLTGGTLLAVKGKGGMWHPEAVERLAAPIKDRLVIGQAEALRNNRQILEGMTITPPSTDLFAERMVRNYLNKWAGTKEDPLAKVEIPSGMAGVDRSWGDLWDAAIVSQKAEWKGSETTIPGARAGETVYTIGAHAGIDATQSISAYLSHVGDYLRQKVAPEKLQQYDLVRAVRETAKWDEDLARQMQKEQGDISKLGTVHKEYPDGYKWVELKAAPGAKLPKGIEITDFSKHGGPAGFVFTEHGKPIEDTRYHTRAQAEATIPTFITKRLLKQEGDMMGHCVGGYCDYVESGKSKIYSLRDPKGGSHVTIEVSPERIGKIDPNNNPKSASIEQIKGKQNRAPAPEYLPYVQDFVKSQKWGAVQELHNAGLVKFRGEFLTHEEGRKLIAAERGNPDVERLAQQYPELLRQQPETPARYQAGFINEKLLRVMAGVGLGGLVGAYIDYKNPAAGAAWGALLAGAAAGALPFREIVNKMDTGFGMLPTRLGHINPILKWAMIESERDLIKGSHDRLAAVDDFLVKLNRPGTWYRPGGVPAEQLAKVNEALLSNKPGEIAAAIKATGNDSLAQAYQKVRVVLDDVGRELETRGVIKRTQADYFPRSVKDYEGLMASPAINVEVKSKIESALAQAEAETLKTRGSGLTNEERSSIINKQLEVSYPASDQPGFAKRRTIRDVTKDLVPFYHTPTEALHQYIGRASQDIARAKFFGKDLAVVKKEGLQYTNVDASIGSVVDRLLREGKITRDQTSELRRILHARFTGGDKSPWGVLQDTKNYINTGLLANWGTGARQLGDLATVAYTQGLLNSIEGTVRTLTGNSRLNIKQFGLVDHISEEFVNPRKSARFQNKMFKYTFSPFDTLGKNIGLEAALIRFEKLSQTPAGIAELRQRFGEVYGEKFPQLVKDFQERRVTQLTEGPPFHELVDMQPITRSNTSAWALENPNGKAVVGWLKSYIHQQSDIVRRHAYDEIKRGNVRAGVTNLVRYALYLGGANATINSIIDWIQGKPWALEPWDVPLNVLKNFGWSQASQELVSEGRPVAAISSFLYPPFRVMDDLVQRSPKLLRYIPYIGDQLYARFGGGNEKLEKRKRQEEMKGLSPEERRMYKQFNPASAGGARG